MHVQAWRDVLAIASPLFDHMLEDVSATDIPVGLCSHRKTGSIIASGL
jgi:hypothetical protein